MKSVVVTFVFTSVARTLLIVICLAFVIGLVRRNLLAEDSKSALKGI
jgi:hypothetical protein